MIGRWCGNAYGLPVFRCTNSARKRPRNCFPIFALLLCSARGWSITHGWLLSPHSWGSDVKSCMDPLTGAWWMRWTRKWTRDPMGLSLQTNRHRLSALGLLGSVRRQTQMLTADSLVPVPLLDPATTITLYRITVTATDYCLSWIPASLLSYVCTHSSRSWRLKSSAGKPGQSFCNSLQMPFADSKTQSSNLLCL